MLSIYLYFSDLERAWRYLGWETKGLIGLFALILALFVLIRLVERYRLLPAMQMILFIIGPVCRLCYRFFFRNKIDGVFEQGGTSTFVGGWLASIYRPVLAIDIRSSSLHEDDVLKNKLKSFNSKTGLKVIAAEYNSDDDIRLVLKGYGFGETCRLYDRKHKKGHITLVTASGHTKAIDLTNKLAGITVVGASGSGKSFALTSIVRMLGVPVINVGDQVPDEMPGERIVVGSEGLSCEEAWNDLKSRLQQLDSGRPSGRSSGVLKAVVVLDELANWADKDFLESIQEFVLSTARKAGILIISVSQTGKAAVTLTHSCARLIFRIGNETQLQVLAGTKVEPPIRYTARAIDFPGLDNGFVSVPRLDVTVSETGQRVKGVGKIVKDFN